VALLPLYSVVTIKLKFQCFVGPRIISFCDKEFEILDFHFHFCLPASASLLSLHFVLSALLTFRLLLWCAISSTIRLAESIISMLLVLAIDSYLSSL